MKTNYKKIKIIKDLGIHIHKYFSPELKLEYDKLITDMKVFLETISYSRIIVVSF